VLGTFHRRVSGSATLDWTARCNSAYLNGSQGSVTVVHTGPCHTGLPACHTSAHSSHNLLLYNALARKRSRQTLRQPLISHLVRAKFSGFILVSGLNAVVNGSRAWRRRIVWNSFHLHVGLRFDDRVSQTLNFVLRRGYIETLWFSFPHFFLIVTKWVYQTKAFSVILV